MCLNLDLTLWGSLLVKDHHALAWWPGVQVPISYSYGNFLGHIQLVGGMVFDSL